MLTTRLELGVMLLMGHMDHSYPTMKGEGYPTDSVQNGQDRPDAAGKRKPYARPA